MYGTCALSKNYCQCMVCEVNWIKELVLSNIVYTWKLFKMKFKIFWNRNNCNQFN